MSTQDSHIPKKVVFINPYQTGDSAKHEYDNIQSAYTYIIRHWKCSRKRAKEIFQAVVEGKDITTWPESKHAQAKFGKDTL